MQKIRDTRIRLTSANSKSKLDRAFYPAYSQKDEEFKISVMSKQKSEYSDVNKSTLNGQLAEAERFDRSFRNSESEYQSPDSEFHWMAHASYNLSKLTPELLNKTKKNEK